MADASSIEERDIQRLNLSEQLARRDYGNEFIDDAWEYFKHAAPVGLLQQIMNTEHPWGVMATWVLETRSRLN